MELYQIKYLLSVVRYQSYTKAADAIGVTQPALSIAIKKLEAELGVKLLEKAANGVVYTSAGSALEKAFAKVQYDVDSIYRIASDFNNSGDYRVRLGIPEFGCDDLFDAIQNEFAADDGSCNVGIAQVSFFDLERKLVEDALELCVCSKPLRLTNLCSEELVKLECCAYMSPQHPYADKERITPHMLEKTPLLISGRNEGTSGAVIRWMEKYAGPFQPVRGSMLLPNAVLRRAEKSGIAILPRNIDVRGYDLISRPLDPPLTLDLVLAWKDQALETTTQRQLRKFIINYYGA